MKKMIVRSSVPLFLLFLAFFMVSCGNEEIKVSATLSATDGTVEIAGPDGEWRVATPGTKIDTTMSVRTAKGAKATLLIDDGSKVYLDEETTLAIKELARPVSKSTFDVVLELVKGAIFSDVTKRDGTKFEVETSVSVAGVKGTKFIVDVRGLETNASNPARPFENGSRWYDIPVASGTTELNPDSGRRNGAIVACLEGNVWVSAADNRENRIVLTEGEAIEILKSMQMSKPQALEQLRIMFCGFPVMKGFNPSSIIFRNVVIHGK